MLVRANLAPVLVYAAGSLALAIFARRAKLLLALLAASYCGAVVLTFTRGTMGSVLFVQIPLLLSCPLLLRPPAVSDRTSATVNLWTVALLAIYVLATGVALLRYDPETAFSMAGRFQSFAGIPLNVLMAGYRLFVVFTLFLAFMIPLRYRVDRATMAAALTVCWFCSVVLSAAGVINYLGLANLRFDVTTAVMGRDSSPGLQDALLGFRRGAHGCMLIMGIFLTFALMLITRSAFLRLAAWLSAPLLIAGLLLSWSRAAALGAAIAVATLVIAVGTRQMWRSLLLAIFAAAVLIALLATRPDLANRMSFFRTAQADASIRGRLATWSELLDFLSGRPDLLITGVGFQNFSYSLKSSEKAVSFVGAHNTYLHMLAETGIIGLMVFAGWIIAIFHWLRVWHLRGANGDDRAMPGVFASAMLGLLVSALTQETLVPAPSVVPWLLHFYLILGLWLSWYQTEFASGRPRLGQFVYVNRNTRDHSKGATRGPAL